MNFLRRLFGQTSEEEAQDQHDEEQSTTNGAAAPETVESPLEASVTPTKPPIPPDAVDDALDDNFQRADPESHDQSLIKTAPLAPEYEMTSGTRQLPQMEEVEAFATSSLSFGYGIDVGMTRENNQDALVAYAVSLRSVNQEVDFGLFGVADGMGGHQHGEKASAIVTSTMTESVINNIYLPLLRLSPDEEDVAEAIPIGEVLLHALHEANESVLRVAPGSGTTATFAVTIGNAAYVAHIGDSRAYLVNGQSIEQITRDHSLAQRLFEVGQLTREEMGSFPRRNELYKVVGFTNDMEPDLNTRRLPPGSYLLLCSDGLWGEVPEIIMQDVVITAPNPHAACVKLVQMANERGGHDNISVVIVKIPT